MIEIKLIISAILLFVFGVLFLVNGLSRKNKMLFPFFIFGLIFFGKIILIVQNFESSFFVAIINFILFLNVIFLTLLIRRRTRCARN